MNVWQEFIEALVLIFLAAVIAMTYTSLGAVIVDALARLAGG